jgi:hypothetical protein
VSDCVSDHGNIILYDEVLAIAITVGSFSVELVLVWGLQRIVYPDDSFFSFFCFIFYPGVNP